MFGTRRALTLDDVDYTPGRKFRVVKSGLRLSGWAPVQGGGQGWGQRLQPGDIIECTGFGPGWGSDPGHGVEWTTEEAKAAHAYNVTLYPDHGGPWAYRPTPGSVVPVDDEDGE